MEKKYSASEWENLKPKLSAGISAGDISRIVVLQQDEALKQSLYDLILGEDERAGYHAAWVFTHFSREDFRWLYDKQDQLIGEVMVCRHGGKRRALLNILYRQPLDKIRRVDFLDFCLERMLSAEELPGVQSLCMKIAYELCLPIPELTHELKTTLEMIEGDLCPAIRTVRRNILKAMQRGKSLQKQAF
ncbi:MAG TPA: hypothetical protein DIT04_02320 [Dysgonomonas sp.]|nr:hypothetical protein [Dysgonomonas sp.]